MSSRGKKKTTMAKLSRESRLRERRVEKAQKREARRHAQAVEAADGVSPSMESESPEGLEIPETTPESDSEPRDGEGIPAPAEAGATSS
jgi:hypothetical protein